MRKFWESLAFWRRWDDRERAVAVKIIGLLVAAIAVFVLIGTVSYLFHWKEDTAFRLQGFGQIAYTGFYSRG